MPSFTTSFKFDTLIMVDSIPSNEYPQTGVWLHDDVLMPLCQQHGVNLCRVRVENRVALFQALSEVAAFVRDASISPVIHFESHGTEEGIQLADRDIVRWPELRPLLTEINVGCRMNLLTIMSMCHGWHLVSQLVPTDRAPVWALIGPVPEVLPARLQEAFQAFYPRLLDALDGRQALAAMNAEREGTRWELKIELAELMFCKTWRRYEQELCSPDALGERTDNIVVQWVRRSGYDLRYAIYGRPIARQSLESTEESFDHFRRSFLLLDLFPDNATRFALTYRDCVDAKISD
jgi:hypothetical protein